MGGMKGLDDEWVGSLKKDKGHSSKMEEMQGLKDLVFCVSMILSLVN